MRTKSKKLTLVDCDTLAAFRINYAFLQQYRGREALGMPTKKQNGSRRPCWRSSMHATMRSSENNNTACRGETPAGNHTPERNENMKKEIYVNKRIRAFRDPDGWYMAEEDENGYHHQPFGGGDFDSKEEAIEYATNW